MMTLGAGVTSDSDLTIGHPYLARIGQRYLVAVPICPEGTSTRTIAYKKAAFIDPKDKEIKKFVLFSEVFPIL